MAGSFLLMGWCVMLLGISMSLTLAARWYGKLTQRWLLRCWLELVTQEIPGMAALL